MLRALTNLRLFPSTSACRRFASTTGQVQETLQVANCGDETILFFQENTSDPLEKDEISAAIKGQKYAAREPYSTEALQILK